MKKYLAFLFLVIFTQIYAQKETNYWFFGGYSGLDFSSGTPVSISGGQTDTEEGVASISDPCGNLLFYTDGMSVWNKNHMQMPNGTGLFGDNSTTSAIIVPKPGNPDLYYIFTLDEAFSMPSSDGFRYSIVDMSLDNGNGAITQKNIELVNSASEKVTVIESADASAFWIVTLAPDSQSTALPYQTVTTSSDFNTFYAFKLTNQGLENTAVLSHFPGLSISGGAGYMKISPNGTKLAIANFYYNHNAFLFDFDTQTGSVSNLHQMHFTTNNINPYGIEFSPDSSKLYFSFSDNKLVQFDLNNFDTINNNYFMTVISTDYNYRSALQLANDGKIYQTHTINYGSGTRYMSFIENPDEVGVFCNYNYRNLNLNSGQECHQGLPNFVVSFFKENRTLPIVLDNNDIFHINYYAQIASVDWDFDDGTTATTTPDNPPYDNHVQVSHSFQNGGVHNVTAVVHLTGGCDISAGLQNNTTAVENLVFNKVKTYPNPVTDRLHIDIGNLKGLQVQMINADGKELQKTVRLNQQKNIITVNLAKGIYYLKLTYGDKIEYRKIIISPAK